SAAPELAGIGDQAGAGGEVVAVGEARALAGPRLDAEREPLRGETRSGLGHESDTGFIGVRLARHGDAHGERLTGDDRPRKAAAPSRARPPHPARGWPSRGVPCSARFRASPDSPGGTVMADPSAPDRPRVRALRPLVESDGDEMTRV